MDDIIKKIGKPFSFSVIDNLIISWQESLSSTLSEESYSNFVFILKPIMIVCLVLLPIYIIYSTLYFIYRVLFKRKIKPSILISIAISLVVLYIVYVSYLIFFIS